MTRLIVCPNCDAEWGATEAEAKQAVQYMKCDACGHRGLETVLSYCANHDAHDDCEARS